MNDPPVFTCQPGGDPRSTYPTFLHVQWAVSAWRIDRLLTEMSDRDLHAVLGRHGLRRPVTRERAEIEALRAELERPTLDSRVGGPVTIELAEPVRVNGIIDLRGVHVRARMKRKDKGRAVFEALHGDSASFVCDEDTVVESAICGGSKS